MASGDEQLISFILKAREKGRTDEQIARSLYSVGWKKDRVDAAFVAANERMKGAAPGEMLPEQHEEERESGGEGQAGGEEKEEEQQALPAQPLRGRVQLSTPKQPLGGSRYPSAPPQQGAPPSGAPPQTGRIVPPAKPAAMQPQRAQEQQPAQGGQQYPMQQPSQQEGQPERKIPMLPTIPPAEAHAPIELPHGPDYPEVHDESQVQNPAFPKVAGGVSKLDLEFIVRVVLFLIILGVIIWGYFYITGSGSPIVVSG